LAQATDTAQAWVGGPMAPEHSASPVMPGGHRGMAKEIMAEMFFSTSSRSALPDHVTGAPPKLEQALRDGAKYRELRGRLAVTQPHGWKPSEVAKPSRVDCHYAREYVPRPLDNAPLDRDAARLQMEADRGGGQFSTGQPLASETTTKQSYPAYPGASPPRPFLPAPVNLGRSSSGPEFLVRESSMKSDFPAHSKDVVRRFRSEAAKPPVNQAPLPRPCEAGNGFSKYKEDFSTSKCCFRPGLLPPASKPRALDHDVLSCASTQGARACRREEVATARMPWH